MADWGGSDILSGGKGSGTGSSSAADYLAGILAQQTTNSNVNTSPGNPAPNQAAAPSAPPAAPQATGNPGNDPNNPPGQVGRGPGQYMWQGGRWVSQDYSHDATGRQLTPEESAAAKDYDRRRAEAGSIARSANRGGGTAKPEGNQNAVYNPITQTYSILKPDGTWVDGISKADLASQLPEDMKKEYPDWWWGNYERQQDQARRAEIDAGAYDAQRFAVMSSTGTRYGPTNF